MNDPSTILGTRRPCGRCKRRRKVNAVWQDTGYMLCTQCSRIPGMAYAASIRSVRADNRYSVKLESE